MVWPLCWNRPCRVRLLAFAERVYKNIATCSFTETSLSSRRSCLSRKHLTKLWNTYFSIRKSLLHLNSWPSKISLTYSCPVRMEVWIRWRLLEPLSPLYTASMMANSSSSRCLRFKKFPHIDGATRRTNRGQRRCKYQLNAPTVATWFKFSRSSSCPPTVTRMTDQLRHVLGRHLHA